ncbi:hypothetical protein PENNAL_c0021G06247 [Penicillium nalgiovense]|uniref:BZIP domain-containing protein n=1 Tax=Penicillium nalgiovense TaxID=60175 RepID=A0A1V6YGA4_PENNA|nr:hypothetical protein PENNAL_c0021G06247 [Penicillium nalgiovense]
MDSTKDQKKNAERLARVRENQRKSRARKQEYVNELEQRLAVYKEQAHQKDIEHRLVTQKVEAENRHLRALLGSLGVSSASVQQYLQEADTGANINRKVAIPAIQRIEGENPLSLSRRDVRRSNLLMAVPRVYKEEPETTELRAAWFNQWISQKLSGMHAPLQWCNQQKSEKQLGVHVPRQWYNQQKSEKQLGVHVPQQWYNQQKSEKQLGVYVPRQRCKQQISHRSKRHKKKIRLYVDAEPTGRTRKRYLMKMCSIRLCVPLQKK